MIAQKPLLALLVSVFISYSVLNQVQVATTSSGSMVGLLFSATILTIVLFAIAMATGTYLLFISMEPKRALTSGGETGQAPPAVHVNTHSEGWSILSFLISFLWFKINATPVFPLGFIGGLVIAFWSSDIDRALGKQPLLRWSIILAVIGMIIGFIIQ